MKGQWIGRYTGDVEGEIVINIDDLGKKFGGVAYLSPDNNKIPSTAAYFKTENKSSKNKVKASTLPINPIYGMPDAWENVEGFYPDASHSSEAEANVHYKEDELHVKAKTNLDIKFESFIAKKPLKNSSDIDGEVKNWEDFKTFISTLSEKNMIFRGQRKPWKLRTSFHRKGRYDLSRFLNEDRTQLHRSLSARTSHVFNLDIPTENGAFLNLVQHHGYPTPLLDWTYSPYVASFFAFRGVPKSLKSDEHVRIYIFDQENWKIHWKQLVMLDTSMLHLSVMEFIAIENERLIPQQAVTTVTNIDDIEIYTKEKEAEKKCCYISAIDIPVSERNKVMNELSFMGITAGSMFPGLDGACEELREKMFDE